MTKILIEIDPELQRVVPVESTEEMLWVAARHYDSNEYTGVRSTYKAMLSAAPQPEPVDADLRRDAELWRAHQKRKQDLIDRGFLRNPLRAAPQVCIAEIVTIDAAISQGEQK